MAWVHGNHDNRLYKNSTDKQVYNFILIPLTESSFWLPCTETALEHNNMAIITIKNHPHWCLNALIHRATK